jgi:hypothetical protein
MLRFASSLCRAGMPCALDTRDLPSQRTVAFPQQSMPHDTFVLRVRPREALSNGARSLVVTCLYLLRHPWSQNLAVCRAFW